MSRRVISFKHPLADHGNEELGVPFVLVSEFICPRGYLFRLLHEFGALVGSIDSGPFVRLGLETKMGESSVSSHQKQTLRALDQPSRPWSQEIMASVYRSYGIPDVERSLHKIREIQSFEMFKHGVCPSNTDKWCKSLTAASCTGDDCGSKFG